MADRFVSKRRARMYKWLSDNPYRFYGDYRDQISDEMAQMIIAGEFDSFYDEFSEWEFSLYDYADLSDLKSEFASEFGYDSFAEMPEGIKDLFNENVAYDTSDYFRTCVKNWSGNVVARLVKRNGEYIEFPCEWEHDKEYARKLADYLKRHCGIEKPYDNEAGYSGSYLVALGTIDLMQILEKRQKPTHLWISERDFTLGHNSWNGSGTCANDQYKGKRRKMKAEFRIDSAYRYGVQSVYGLTDSCWSNELELAFS